MACLVPQFKCLSFPLLPYPAVAADAKRKTWLRIQCAASTAVMEAERLLSLESQFALFGGSARPLGYAGAPGPPNQQSEAALSTEKLLHNEEAMVQAAAAQALALARAAVELARDAAKMVQDDQSIKQDRILSKDSPGNLSVFTERELEYLNGNSSDPLTLEEDKVHDLFEGSNFSEILYDESELERWQHKEGIAVKSTRRTERKARRSRAADKFYPAIAPAKKKRSPTQELARDPLRFVRAAASSHKILTAVEEMHLSEGVQDLLKLERLYEDLTQQNGVEPTFARWAGAAGIDQKTLRKRLDHGKYCREKMVNSNIRLVVSIAKNYRHAGLGMEDIIQEGCRGLVKGVEKFDASKGFKFSTYAHWWIKQAVRKALTEHSRTIRLPSHIVEASYRVKDARREFVKENGREPCDQEISAITGISMRRLETVQLAPKYTVSLQQKIGHEGNTTYAQVVSDPDAETTEEILMRELMKRDLGKLLDSLSAREKRVVQLRFGIDDGRMKTLQEIGDIMGISRERVRQIEGSAFRKLKSKKRVKNLEQYLIP